MKLRRNHQQRNARWLVYLLVCVLLGFSALALATFITLNRMAVTKGLVVSCFKRPTIKSSAHHSQALPVVLSHFLALDFIDFDEALRDGGGGREWDIWATCSTSSRDRIPPSFSSAVAGRDALVLFVPGKCAFASKVGLWQGLEKRFGTQEAGRIAPRTFVRPDENSAALREYLRVSQGNQTFVLKSGHRQRGIRELMYNNVGGDGTQEAFLGEVARIAPRVIQVKVEAKRLLGRRTAFRTYTWIECKPETGAVVATVDWNSPAYVALGEEDLVASGYKTKSDYSAHELIVALGVEQEMRAVVKRKVSQFLSAFGPSMCFGSSGGARTEELFAFDWIPTVDNDAMLLEVNRFPDMQLHSAWRRKDWLKLCTYLRRMPERLVWPSKHSEWKQCMDASAATLDLVT